MSADLLDVVLRCRRGEPDAWRALLPTFQEIGRRALRSFRLSAADLDDVLAEVLTSLYAGGLSQFRGGTIAELVGFLRTVARNRALDFVKERNRWAPRDYLDQADETAAVPVGGSDPVDVARGVADDECLAFLRQEVAMLKRGDRELYLMKARGLKEREIAELTGRSAGTVASQIARLLERLRERLRDRGCV